MRLLVKRETSLADTLDALTTLLLHQLSSMFGRREEFFRFCEQVSKFLGPTERDLAVGWIPKRPPGGLEFTLHARHVAMVERPDGILRLATEVGDLITSCEPKSLQHALDALTVSVTELKSKRQDNDPTTEP